MSNPTEISPLLWLEQKDEEAPAFHYTCSAKFYIVRFRPQCRTDSGCRFQGERCGPDCKSRIQAPAGPAHHPGTRSCLRQWPTNADSRGILMPGCVQDEIKDKNVGNFVPHTPIAATRLNGSAAAPSDCWAADARACCSAHAHARGRNQGGAGESFPCSFLLV